jgi:hypothetical protein
VTLKRVMAGGAANRIIAATGKEPDDIARLMADIDKAFRDFQRRGELYRWESAEADKLIRRLCRILKTHANLVEAHPSLPLAVNVLKRSEEMRRDQKESRKRKGAAMEWLAGQALPTIYRDRFGAPVRWRRDADRKPEGAVIRFVEAVLAELKLPYARGSIGRAITNKKPQVGEQSRSLR